MPTKVVDASAVAAMLFREPEATAVAQQLDSCQLVAPPLPEFELGNVCLTKLRRHPDQRGELWRASGGVRTLPWRSEVSMTKVYCFSPSGRDYRSMMRATCGLHENWTPCW
ncbi:MAG TPA: hypothetical protein VKI44_11510 [Acetobacteraceae bacterium]|nr:hypothetical protein [Acetobacteraceae bacterium]